MKRIFILAVASLLTMQLSADPISRQTAQYTAREFLASKGISMTNAHVAFKAPRLGQATQSQAYYYVVDAGDENGYVIVSGDDRTEPILGYVDNGHFDAEAIPENMKSFLQSYADQIKSMDDNHVQVDAAARVKRRITATYHSVPTLMPTRWNQGSPYNDNCPIHYNSDGSSGSSASGCVATALTQVMNFYRHPVVTKAAIPSLTNTYNTNSGTKTVKLNSVPKGTPIDWENMCNTYSGNETQEQKQAVANLMLYVGQSVGMGYGASSGAIFGDNVVTAFTKYFDYDDQLTMEWRDRYSIDGWFNLIYNEVAAGHPVAMSGSSSGGAHAFVVDGFDGENLFHLNWGWGGGSDGYFLISVLNPGDNSGMGASSSSDGYSMGTNALIGVRYPDDVKVEQQTALTVNDITVSGTSIGANYINWTGKVGTFRCGIVRETEDGTYLPVGTTETATNLNPNTYQYYRFDMKNRLNVPGKYKLSPATRISTHRTWIPQLNMYSEYILAEVDEDGKITLTYHHPDTDLKVDTMEFIGTKVLGEQQDVRVTFSNNGQDDYYKEVHIFASNTTSKGTSNCRSAVNVKPGGKAEVTFYFTPSKLGTYNVWLTEDSEGKKVIAHTTVEITNSSAANTAKLNMGTITLTNGSGTTAYGPMMKGTVAIQNKRSEKFSGRIKLQLWIKNVSDNTCWSANSSIHELTVDGGRTKSMPFEFSGLELNRTYFVSAYYMTQSGELDNGGLVWDHAINITPGILYWKNDGSLMAQASKSLYTMPSTGCGTLLTNVNVNRVTPNKNPNTIYVVEEGTKLPSGVSSSQNLVYAGQADSLHLVSGQPYYAPVSFTAQDAFFTHTFTAAGNGESGWQAITLPFVPDSVLIDGEATTWLGSEARFCIREFAYLGDNNEVIFSDAETLRDNTPYVIACAPELVGKSVTFRAKNVNVPAYTQTKRLVSSVAYTFHGTTTTSTVTGGYVLNEEGTAFEYRETKTGIEATVPYFTTTLPEEQRADRLPIGQVPDLSNAICLPGAVEVDGPVAVYNLQGQKVALTQLHGGKVHLQGLTPGIYVVAGQKVLVK